MKKNFSTTEVLIIGSGIAGCTAALQLSQLGHQVVLVTKNQKPEESNTYYAQGGIIYQGKHDSPQQLADDIIRAGANLSDPKAVSILTQEGPALVKQLLIDQAAVSLDYDGKNLALAKEGGHSIARIVHSADATGKSIEIALIAQIKGQKNIKLITGLTALDLITSTRPDKHAAPVTCHGAHFFNSLDSGISSILAGHVILATGGLGSVYLYSTNPEGARGDGIAMAHRAGASVLDMEYVQFHPTAFYHPNSPRFLLSEAIRGDGARLVDAQGNPFMDSYSKDWKDLAPRDVVARAIFREMLTHNQPNVYLDLRTYISPKRIKAHFPNLYSKCLQYDVDMTKDLVPVVPAAHYHCGGVWVDGHGQTTINNLYAIGEVSRTGLHGANRLASTSLLEGLVWGNRAALHIHQKRSPQLSSQPFTNPRTHLKKEAPDSALIDQDANLIRRIMWNYVGLVRTKKNLTRACADLNYLGRRIERFYRHNRLTESLISLKNLSLVSRLITQAALKNTQSAGCHYRLN